MRHKTQICLNRLIKPRNFRYTNVDHIWVFVHKFSSILFLRIMIRYKLIDAPKPILQVLQTFNSIVMASQLLERILFIIDINLQLINHLTLRFNFSLLIRYYLLVFLLSNGVLGQEILQLVFAWLFHFIHVAFACFFFLFHNLRVQIEYGIQFYNYAFEDLVH